MQSLVPDFQSDHHLKLMAAALLVQRRCKKQPNRCRRTMCKRDHHEAELRPESLPSEFPARVVRW